LTTDTRYKADLGRVCDCTNEFNVGDSGSLIKGPYGLLERCPSCGKETPILGEYQEQAMDMFNAM
jgi:hypothetical protein